MTSNTDQWQASIVTNAMTGQYHLCAALISSAVISLPRSRTLVLSVTSPHR